MLTKHDSEFRFPPLFTRIGQAMPSTLASAPLMLMLDLARRANWLSAPDTLNGKCFGIRVNDLGLDFTFTCEKGKFRHHAGYARRGADVVLSANAIDFFKLASGVEDADTLFFRRRLQIQGDTELGIAVKYWIDASERPAWLLRMGEKLAATSA
ncbi:MAG: SCP2 sterol-binding domain-containing protein [Undibacterium sp.]|nr:SCP2 sterol-binding domain-containing protein [Undibacterium sp.]